MENSLEQQSSSSAVKRILATKQGKTYTVLLVTIGTVLLMFILAIRPAWISIVNKLAENKVKRQYIADADEKIRTLQNLDQEYSTRVSAVKYLNLYLAEEPHESFVIENIMGLVRKKKITFLSITSSRPEAVDRRIQISDPQTSQVQFNINVTSNDLSELASFVKDLETIGLDFHILQVSYQSREKGEQSTDKWQLFVQGIYFIYDINNLKAKP